MTDRNQVAEADGGVPRPEYPRPQFVRDAWLNLNGTWQFEIDRGDSGLERGLLETPLAGEILVPFAPESVLSGVEDTDFLTAVWYRREVEVPGEWLGGRVVLHFGAVDHDATVWVNGVEVVRHRGGFSSFECDITDALDEGRGVIVVRARDPRSGPQARGKQSVEYANRVCNYTRTTGIWQTVWLEGVPASSIASLNVTPQLGQHCFDVQVGVRGVREGDRLRVRLSGESGEVALAEVDAVLDLGAVLRLVVPVERLRVWRPEDPHLYDLAVELVRDGQVVDMVQSYAGLRSVSIQGRRVLLNGEPVFQRLVLDQGYWPDSLLTAPDDEALVRDIELSMAAGFNGARIHQRVAEERFLFHCDRLGYLVWGEFADWGAGVPGPDEDHQRQTVSFVTQWLEVLERDRNHPSIVGWCPLNETWQVISDHITQLDDVTHAMWLATKLADASRPVLDASGYSHREARTEVYDVHNYEQDPAEFARQLQGLAQGEPYINRHEEREISLPYGGQPYFVSEFGGIWWNAELAAEAAGSDRDSSWGYGDRVATLEDFYQRFQGLVDVLLDDPEMFGYCYTQLTDTFQEQNGIFAFDRSAKFDVERLRRIQSRRAAFEGNLGAPVSAGLGEVAE